MAVAVLVKQVCKDMLVFTHSISSLFLCLLSKLLAENMDGENREESSTGSAQDTAVLSNSLPMTTADFASATLARDRGGTILP